MDVQIDDSAPLLLPAPSPSRPLQLAEARKRRNYPFNDIEMTTEHSPKRARLGTRNSIENASGLAVVAEESLSLLQSFGGAVASLSSLSSSSLMSAPSSSSIPLDARSSSEFAYPPDTTLPPSMSSRPQSYSMSRSNSSVVMNSRTGSRSNSEAGTPAPGGKSTPQHSFWFEDGDVILSVQDVYFRVHGSKLSDCSTSFRLLRENGWKPRGMDCPPDKLDGRPIVRLQDDAPKDWIVVLEAIYEAPSVLHFIFVFKADIATGPFTFDLSCSTPSEAYCAYRQNTISVSFVGGLLLSCGPLGQTQHICIKWDQWPYPVLLVSMLSNLLLMLTYACHRGNFVGAFI